jgi:hypothetical protein
MTTLPTPTGRSRPHALTILGALVLLLGYTALHVTAALAAAEPCPNEQLRAEQPFGSGLADCRAYEMVSPLEKDDNSASYIDSRAAVSGEAVTYPSIGAFAEPKSALLEGRYISRREAEGWSTRNISPPYTGYTGDLGDPPFSEFMSPDLSSGILLSDYTPLAPGQQAGYVNLYLADTETGAYQPVSVPAESEYKPFQEQLNDEVPQVEGTSTDLDHVVFQQEASLCCGAARKPAKHVYEWSDGKLALVDVPPTGVKLEGATDVGSTANKDVPALFGDSWRAVSADGSRVIFSAQGKEEGIPEARVFVRENPMNPVEGCLVAGDSCTVEVSASQKTNGAGLGGSDPNAAKNPAAWYRDASADGSRVFFVSRVELTNDAYTGPEDNAGNLYEYDFNKPEGERLTDLTVDEADPDGAQVLGVVTASEDGSYLYFAAAGKLTGEQNGEGQEAVAGKPNLYLTHAGRTTFIATLGPTRINVYHSEGHNENGDEEDWIGEEGLSNDYGPGSHTVRVTPDGTLLAFESERRLTAYDNEPAEPRDCTETQGVELSGTNPSIPCREVYLYDAVTGKLICASCDPDGLRPVGPAELGGHENEAESTSTVLPYYLPRNFSDNGGRLFFQSPDSLVSHDSNGLLDVYEWERSGEGSCTTASTSYALSHEGCTFAISDVAGSSESHFMDASASGDDVFIATGDQLVPADTDTREDVYDVRVGGGFPITTVPPVCVNADACKPPVSPQPELFAAPASATFSGPGNPTPEPPPPPPAVGTAKLKPKTAAQTSAGRLTKALKACRKTRSRKKRAACERQAHRRYDTRKAHS